MKLKHLSLSVMMMGAASVTVSTQAVASGYHFGSQSVSSQGTAFANGAEAADSSTIFYNPAGLSRLDGTQFSGGVTLVIPDSKYTEEGSTRNSGAATGGNNGGSFAPGLVAAPSLYLSHRINDKITVGLGVFVPFGAKLDYDKTWAGRYALQNIKLETFNLNPSVSFKLDDHHAFGFGVSAQHMKAKLAKGVDVASGISNAVKYTAAGQALATSKISAGVVQAVGGQAAYQTLVTAAAGGNTTAATTLANAKTAVTAALGKSLAALPDGQARMDADDWGFGFNLGYMYTLDENTRFGIAYRSNIQHKLKGNAIWDYTGVTDPAILAALRASHDNSAASVDVNTPESVAVNAFHQLTPTIALMGDVTWTAHSRMKSIDIKFPGTHEGDLVIKQEWKDTVKVSVGANYQYSDAVLLRAGLAYDQSPVKNDSLRHPALPDSDRYVVSLGANYKFNKQSSVDFAYSYMFFKKAKVNFTDTCRIGADNTCTGNGETTIGNYKTNLQMVGLQYNYSF
ncbi:OmpP1/FadL family transporter [Paludibacterium paludis]|uniref:Outer membrane protein n=1 Tax=Paludibacterium paludis TaxID=1225769 RepID=A0A918P308_9NEIS|nr:OmpP1/FadL family transporter [Paludibacterium paludis]GGY17313.1 putative outer membrane protein [Paludibacterium paludis]